MKPARILFAVLLLSLVSGSLHAQQRTNPIRWTTSPQQAVDFSRTSQRPLLLYFTTGYCGYCRKLEQTTWSNESVKQIISSNFIPVKIDGESQAQIAKRFGVDGYPTVIVLSPDGSIQDRITGYLGSQQMAAKLHSTIKAKPAVVTLAPTAN